MAKKIGWDARGKVWDPLLGKPSDDDQEIPVEEDTFSVKFDNNTKAYGQPIDNYTTVKLIRKFIDRIGSFKIFSSQPKGSWSSATEPPENWKEIEDTLKELLEQSMGMTFDKSLILKILSQPKCEGIRFYLCEKTVDNKPFISLALVGVDEIGNDLHFKNANSTITAEGPNSSLTGEYGHPPNNRFTKDYKEMVLLNRARSLPLDEL